MGDTTTWSKLLDNVGIYDLDDLTGSSIGEFINMAEPGILKKAEKIMAMEGSFEYIADELKMDTEDVMEIYEETIRTFDKCILGDNKHKLRRLLRFYKNALNWNLSLNPKDYLELDGITPESIAAAYYYVILCRSHQYSADMLKCSYREAEKHFQQFNNTLLAVHKKNNNMNNRPHQILMKEEFERHEKQWTGKSSKGIDLIELARMGEV